MNATPPPPATLILGAAPIGRPEDASPRLAAELARAPVVAAEDTRRVRRLAADLGVRLAGAPVSYYDAVEARRVPRLLDELRAGRDVLGFGPRLGSVAEPITDAHRHLLPHTDPTRRRGTPCLIVQDSRPLPCREP